VAFGSVLLLVAVWSVLEPVVPLALAPDWSVLEPVVPLAEPEVPV